MGKVGGGRSERVRVGKANKWSARGGRMRGDECRERERDKERQSRVVASRLSQPTTMPEETEWRTRRGEEIPSRSQQNPHLLSSFHLLDLCCENLHSHFPESEAHSHNRNCGNGGVRDVGRAGSRKLPSSPVQSSLVRSSHPSSPLPALTYPSGSCARDEWPGDRKYSGHQKPGI